MLRPSPPQGVGATTDVAARLDASPTPGSVLPPGHVDVEQVDLAVDRRDRPRRDRAARRVLRMRSGLRPFSGKPPSSSQTPGLAGQRPHRGQDRPDVPVLVRAHGRQLLGDRQLVVLVGCRGRRSSRAGRRAARRRSAASRTSSRQRSRFASTSSPEVICTAAMTRSDMTAAAYHAREPASSRKSARESRAPYGPRRGELGASSCALRIAML